MGNLKVVHHLEIDGPPTDADIETMLAMDGEDIVMTLKRTPQKGRTFSREGMDALGIQMKGWMMSRAFRALNPDIKGHSKMTVTISVKVE